MLLRSRIRGIVETSIGRVGAGIGTIFSRACIAVYKNTSGTMTSGLAVGNTITSGKASASCRANTSANAVADIDTAIEADASTVATGVIGRTDAVGSTITISEAVAKYSGTSIAAAVCDIVTSAESISTGASTNTSASTVYEICALYEGNCNVRAVAYACAVAEVFTPVEACRCGTEGAVSEIDAAREARARALHSDALYTAGRVRWHIIYVVKTIAITIVEHQLASCLADNDLRACGGEVHAIGARPGAFADEYGCVVLATRLVVVGPRRKLSVAVDHVRVAVCVVIGISTRHIAEKPVMIGH